MLISLKLTPPIPIKAESDDEAAANTLEESSNNKVPRISEEDFDCCAGCKAPFRGTRNFVNGAEVGGGGDNEDAEQGTSSSSTTKTKRGQQETIDAIGEGRKIKEFYSFNCVTGELLRVTSLQSILSVFELRLVKSAPDLNLPEANDQLGFCERCGTLFSQLYKLHQEVTGLLHNGSVISKLKDYEELLTDTQEEVDFSNPKTKRRKIATSRVNNSGPGSTLDEMEHDGGRSSYNGDDDGHVDADDTSSWSNHDYDMGNNDDDSYGNDEAAVETEVNNVKSRKKSDGIKITSVASTNSMEDLDLETDSGGARGSRRRSVKPVNYKKIQQGSDDEDEEWQEESHKSTSSKKKAAPPASKASRSRGRPSTKTKSKVVVPPPKAKNPKDSNFKSPADKSSREAACNICKKLFPSNYLAEHMNVAHNAVSGQPCLICGKVFENSYKAIKHLLTHVPEKAFGCSRCHDTFITAEERNVHTSSHLDSDQKLECPKCPNSFTSLLLLNKHEAQKHRQTKSFLCSICAKLLSGKDEWIQHILSHGPFQCYYCKIFLKPGEYKRHVQTVHITRPKLTPSSTGPIAEVDLIDSD